MSRSSFAGTSRGSWTGITIPGLLAAVTVALVFSLLAASPARAVSTFVVNRTTNESDAATGDNVCDVDTGTAGNQCTLKAAIQQANATANSGGPDEIRFAIPGDKKKVKTIKPTSELPALTQPVTIDGYTQPGSKKNTRLTGPSTRSRRYSSTVAGLASTRMA